MSVFSTHDLSLLPGCAIALLFSLVFPSGWWFLLCFPRICPWCAVSKSCSPSQSGLRISYVKQRKSFSYFFDKCELGFGPWNVLDHFFGVLMNKRLYALPLKSGYRILHRSRTFIFLQNFLELFAQSQLFTLLDRSRDFDPFCIWCVLIGEALVLM